MTKSHVTRQWAWFIRGESFSESPSSRPVPALAPVAALTPAVSVAIVIEWDSGGLRGLHPGPWAHRMSEGSGWQFGLSQKLVPWEAVGSGRCSWLGWAPRQRKGPSLDKTVGVVCPQSLQ